MRLALSAIVLVALAAPTSSQTPPKAIARDVPTLKLPAEVKGVIGDFVRVPAETTGQVQWYSPDPGLAVFPSDLLKDSRTAVVIARANGRYRLVAWTAAGDVPSPPVVCVVVIGDVPPDPGPTPPTPPVDPLVDTLRTAFLSDGAGADNVKMKATLTEVYRQGGTKAKDTSIATAAQFQAVVSATGASVLGQSIMNTRRACWAEVVKVLPTPETPLDAATREKLAAVMERVAKALEGIK